MANAHGLTQISTIQFNGGKVIEPEYVSSWPSFGRHFFNNLSFDWQVAFITLFDQVMKDANEGRCLTHE